jgi:DNA mismatch repair protein PMS2
VLNATQVALAQKEVGNTLADEANNEKLPLFISEDEDQNGDDVTAGARSTAAGEPMCIDVDIAPILKEVPSTLSPLDKPHSVQKRPRSVSVDVISDQEARPLKKVSATRSPSPAAIATPSPSTSQRLTGPGRTPARVEQILSANTDGTRRGVQMVLDTSGASWNLKPGQEGPPRKRTHLGDISGGSSSGKNARVSMRARLAGFARDGVRMAQDDDNEEDGDSDSPEEEEGAAEENAPVKERTSKSVENDEGDYEIGSDEGRPSTDEVDETLTIESLDEPSRAVASAGSPNSSRADDNDDTSNEQPTLDSISDGAPSSSSVVVASTSSSSLDLSAVRTEIVRTVVGDTPPLAFDLERTTNAWSAYLERSRSLVTPHAPPTRSSSDLERADLEADDENATAALARVLSKADFGSMDVVGQFNRGFIVTRLRKIKAEGSTDDLFIVDQHASDEKYNFETLQATSRLESQRLFACVVRIDLPLRDRLFSTMDMYIGPECWS